MIDQAFVAWKIDIAILERRHQRQPKAGDF
jgi:hypothetical protein